ncbi:MAG: ATP-binding protein [Phenylobacterium sp.]|uniref:sensor histidine kinase n=1 Tax=Brevundimonas sp. TaxID=1871086 RepID=UPI0027378D8F|nr:ATP-binding protein [Brevundimonas sp.]MDP3801773.1 ATP-binding protein [Brevundimonas sp.]MDZ4370123.1 ATP-binding protein [Phenylobacterium sp.]
MSVAVLLRAGLETVGQFYYLPMVPAVVATAAVAGRKATALAIALSIGANSLLVARESHLDAVVNAGLFALVTWLTAELCWSLRAYRQRTGELSQNLAHREEMLETILASAPVVVLDRAGHIRFISPFACALLDVAEDDAIGRAISSFVDEFDIGDFHTGEEALAGETDRVWTCRRGSETFPLGIQLGFMPTSYPHSHAVLCLADLTQAHLADERARTLHLQLSRVWRLNSLGEMAASLAHELNQPLTAAATYLEAGQIDLRGAGPMGENASRTIGLAKSQLLRAGGIIRHMRELLAHESRGLAGERVSSMVVDLKGVFAMIERSEDVRIDVRVDDRADRVRAERIQFQQAMVNLVRNAADALVGRPNPRIMIVGRPLSDDQYEVRVEDNGSGIPPEELETIFRPMMTTKTGGMGLGLSVTRTIVESHGGALGVERSDLGGAAFSFSLMREQALEDA